MSAVALLNLKDASGITVASGYLRSDNSIYQNHPCRLFSNLTSWQAKHQDAVTLERRAIGTGNIVEVTQLPAVPPPPPRMTWRLFDAEGKRISTAVTYKEGLLQVFPTRCELPDDHAWKALHPSWHEMVAENPVKPESKEDKETARKRAAMARLESQPPHVKMVRALYDEYCVPNTLTFYTNKCKGPMVLYVKLGKMLKPVFFNRKRALFSIGTYKEVLTQFPSEPEAFYVKVRNDYMEVSVPEPLPTDKKTVVLYRRRFPHASDLTAYNYYDDTTQFNAAVAKATEEGCHVKVIRPLNYANKGFNVTQTLWMTHPQVQRVAATM